MLVNELVVIRSTETDAIMAFLYLNPTVVLTMKMFISHSKVLIVLIMSRIIGRTH